MDIVDESLLINLSHRVKRVSELAKAISFNQRYNIDTRSLQNGAKEMIRDTKVLLEQMRRDTFALERSKPTRNSWAMENDRLAMISSG